MSDDHHTQANQLTDSLGRRWQHALAALPLIAILRGIRPDEVIEVGSMLYSKGFRILEVPLNSPDALTSVKQLRESMGEDVIIGAGTVLTPAEVGRCSEAGCELIVAPNFDAGVAASSTAGGMLYCPGIATPSEAFAALAAGAHALKLFPGEMISPAVVKAMRAVLPVDATLLPVGGIGAANMLAYIEAGAAGFGIGSSLYKPGVSLEDLGQRASTLVNAYREACSTT